ncbi:hypothetical protein J4466_05485 [Candidatus Pacearchaeota archaeon]|nr:hypothetical protein [Candidatus Pacearchaeota archaeon]
MKTQIPKSALSDTVGFLNSDVIQNSDRYAKGYCANCNSIGMCEVRKAYCINPHDSECPYRPKSKLAQSTETERLVANA